MFDQIGIIYQNWKRDRNRSQHKPKTGIEIGIGVENWNRSWNRNRHLHGIKPRTGIEKEIGFEVGLSKIITATGKVEVDFKFLIIVEAKLEVGFEHLC